MKPTRHNASSASYYCVFWCDEANYSELSCKKVEKLANLEAEDMVGQVVTVKLPNGATASAEIKSFGTKSGMRKAADEFAETAANLSLLEKEDQMENNVQTIDTDAPILPRRERKGRGTTTIYLDDYDLGHNKETAVNLTSGYAGDLPEAVNNKPMSSQVFAKKSTPIVEQIQINNHSFEMDTAEESDSENSGEEGDENKENHEEFGDDSDELEMEDDDERLPKRRPQTLAQDTLAIEEDVTTLRSIIISQKTQISTLAASKKKLQDENSFLKKALFRANPALATDKIALGNNVILEKFKVDQAEALHKGDPIAFLRYLMYEGNVFNRLQVGNCSITGKPSHLTRSNPRPALGPKFDTLKAFTLEKFKISKKETPEKYKVFQQAVTQLPSNARKSKEFKTAQNEPSNQFGGEHGIDQ